MVYLFLADGVCESEAVTITEVLRRAGIEVLTAGVTGMTITGARGMKLCADVPLSDVPDGRHDMLVLPGGLPGMENLAASERVCELVKSAMENDAPLGAICAAPSILAEMGLLKGRTVTCYPSLAEKVKSRGAYVIDRTWVREGNLLTGQGPAASMAFGVALVSVLAGDDKADALAGQLLLPSWR
jgi:4-methyl-5(b-hydroxyethyl)-thiazole monophosphate biosynthesis